MEEKKEVIPRERMKVTSGLTYKETLGENCGTLYVSVNSDSVGLCEVFVIKGHGGGCLNALLESVGRLASLALASGVPPNYVIDQLKGIRCPHPRMNDGGALLSCPDAIAKIMDRYINKEKIVEKKIILPPKQESVKKTDSVIKLGENPECPQCGSDLIMQEGCLNCKTCGWSRC